MISALFYCFSEIVVLLEERRIIRFGLGNKIYYTTAFFNFCLFLNISSIWLFFKISQITTNYNFDAILLFVVLSIVNWFIFIKRGNARTIFEKYSKNKSFNILLYMIITVVYILASFLFFYLAHSNYYPNKIG